MRAAETDESAATSARRSERRASRSFEWLLQRDALAQALAQVARRSAAQGKYLTRAQVAFEFADRTLEPIQAPRAGASTALALSIYREAAYWALLACKPLREHTDLRTAFEAADRSLLLRAAGDADALALVQSALVGQNFVQSAAASEEVVRAEADAVRGFVRELLHVLRAPEQSLQRARAKRNRRLFVLALGLLACLGAGGWKLRELRQSPDLARGKPWRLSSKLATCHPEQNLCAGTATSILFHTRSEANPWFELDLGSKQTFSVVEIVNRTDCCPDRAFPMIVEVGDDQKQWKTVARSDEPFFSRFSFHFKPVSARYVRLRVPRTTELHLVSVSVRAD